MVKISWKKSILFVLIGALLTVGISYFVVNTRILQTTIIGEGSTNYHSPMVDGYDKDVDSPMFTNFDTLKNAPSIKEVRGSDIGVGIEFGGSNRYTNNPTFVDTLSDMLSAVNITGLRAHWRDRFDMFEPARNLEIGIALRDYYNKYHLQQGTYYGIPDNFSLQGLLDATYTMEELLSKDIKFSITLNMLIPYDEELGKYGYVYDDKDRYIPMIAAENRRAVQIIKDTYGEEAFEKVVFEMGDETYSYLDAKTHAQVIAASIQEMSKVSENIQVAIDVFPWGDSDDDEGRRGGEWRVAPCKYDEYGDLYEINSRSDFVLSSGNKVPCNPREDDPTTADVNEQEVFEQMIANLNLLYPPRENPEDPDTRSNEALFVEVNKIEENLVANGQPSIKKYITGLQHHTYGYTHWKRITDKVRQTANENGFGDVPFWVSGYNIQGGNFYNYEGWLNASTFTYGLKTLVGELEYVSRRDVGFLSLFALPTRVFASFMQNGVLSERVVTYYYDESGEFQKVDRRVYDPLYQITKDDMWITDPSGFIHVFMQSFLFDEKDPVELKKIFVDFEGERYPHKGGEFLSDPDSTYLNPGLYEKDATIEFFTMNQEDHISGVLINDTDEEKSYTLQSSEPMLTVATLTDSNFESSLFRDSLNSEEKDLLLQNVAYMRDNLSQISYGYRQEKYEFAIEKDLGILLDEFDTLSDKRITDILGFALFGIPVPTEATQSFLVLDTVAQDDLLPRENVRFKNGVSTVEQDAFYQALQNVYGLLKTKTEDAAFMEEYYANKRLDNLPKLVTTYQLAENGVFTLVLPPRSIVGVSERDVHVDFESALFESQNFLNNAKDSYRYNNILPKREEKPEVHDFLGDDIDELGWDTSLFLETLGKILDKFEITSIASESIVSPNVTEVVFDTDDILYVNTSESEVVLEANTQSDEYVHIVEYQDPRTVFDNETTRFGDVFREVLADTEEKSQDKRFTINVAGHANLSKAYIDVPVDVQVEYLKDLGSEWYRFDIFGNPSYASMDQVIDTVHDAGIKISATLSPLTGPGNIESRASGQCVGDELYPEAVQARRTVAQVEAMTDAEREQYYLDRLYICNKGFAEKFATRYKDKVSAWELSNEIFTKALLPGRHGLVMEHYDPVKLERIYAFLKGLSDGVDVSGSTAPRIINEGWLHYAPFGELESEGINYEIIAWHWYSNMEKTETDSIEQVSLADGRVIDVLEELEKFGKRVWINEYNIWPSEEGAYSFEEQIEFFRKTFEHLELIHPRVEELFIYQLFDEPETQSAAEREKHFGLVELGLETITKADGTSGTKAIPVATKPAYDFVKAYNTKDATLDFVALKRLENHPVAKKYSLKKGSAITLPAKSVVIRAEEQVEYRDLYSLGDAQDASVVSQFLEALEAITFLGDDYIAKVDENASGFWTENSTPEFDKMLSLDAIPLFLRHTYESIGTYLLGEEGIRATVRQLTDALCEKTITNADETIEKVFVCNKTSVGENLTFTVPGSPTLHGLVLQKDEKNFPKDHIAFGINGHPIVHRSSGPDSRNKGYADVPLDVQFDLLKDLGMSWYRISTDRSGYMQEVVDKANENHVQLLPVLNPPALHEINQSSNRDYRYTQVDIDRAATDPRYSNLPNLELGKDWRINPDGKDFYGMNYRLGDIHIIRPQDTVIFDQVQAKYPSGVTWLASEIVDTSPERRINKIRIFTEEAYNEFNYLLAKRYADALASEFADDIDVWTLTNEYNVFATTVFHSFADSGGVGNFDDTRFDRVVAVIKGLYDGVKEQDPTARTLVTSARVDPNFFDILKEKGIDIDISAFNWYGNVDTIEDEKQMIRDAVERMKDNGDKVWFTEHNIWHGTFDGGNYVGRNIEKEKKQVEYLRQTIPFFASLAPDVENLFVYELLEQPYIWPQQEKYFGLVTLHAEGGKILHVQCEVVNGVCVPGTENYVSGPELPSLIYWKDGQKGTWRTNTKKPGYHTYAAAVQDEIELYKLEKRLDTLPVATRITLAPNSEGVYQISVPGDGMVILSLDEIPYETSDYLFDSRDDYVETAEYIVDDIVTPEGISAASTDIQTYVFAPSETPEQPENENQNTVVPNENTNGVSNINSNTSGTNSNQNVVVNTNTNTSPGIETTQQPTTGGPILLKPPYTTIEEIIGGTTGATAPDTNLQGAAPEKTTCPPDCPSLPSLPVDVQSSHFASEAIGFLAQRSILSGYADGTFKPDNHINRAEFSKLMKNAFLFEALPVVANLPFVDVLEGQWFYEFVKVVYESEVVSGYNNGTEFRPGASIQRDEAAKMVALASAAVEESTVGGGVIPSVDAKVRMKELQIQADYAAWLAENPTYTYVQFEDVSIDAWYAPYVLYNYQNGFIRGRTINGQQIFAPASPITRGETAVLLQRMLERFGVSYPATIDAEGNIEIQ